MHFWKKVMEISKENVMCRSFFVQAGEILFATAAVPFAS